METHARTDKTSRCHFSLLNASHCRVPHCCPMLIGIPTHGSTLLAHFHIFKFHIPPYLLLTSDSLLSSHWFTLHASHGFKALTLRFSMHIPLTPHPSLFTAHTLFFTSHFITFQSLHFSLHIPYSSRRTDHYPLLTSGWMDQFMLLIAHFLPHSFQCSILIAHLTLLTSRVSFITAYPHISLSTAQSLLHTTHQFTLFTHLFSLVILLFLH